MAARKKVNPPIVVPINIEQLKELLSDNYALKDREIAKDNFLQKTWRPAIAVLYLTLLLLDYGIRPVVNQFMADDFDLAATVEVVKDLESSTQIRVIDIAAKHEKWPPILNEFVHLAFGTILTAAAATRGMEKTTRIKNQPARRKEGGA